MEKEDDSLKVYYSIGEVAEMFGVNASLIRFWETEFNIIKPYKNKKGNRLFTKQDIDKFHLIFNLVKEQGMTLRGAKARLNSNPEQLEITFEVIKHLKGIKEELLFIKSELS